MPWWNTGTGFWHRTLTMQKPIWRLALEPNQRKEPHLERGGTFYHKGDLKRAS